MSLQNELAKDLAEAIGDLPCSAEWQGCQLRGSVATIEDSFHLQFGGDVEEAKLHFVVNRHDFGNRLPQPRDAFKVDGVEYRVVSVQSAPNDPAVTLALALPTIK